MSYKVIYYLGVSINIKTDIRKGLLTLKGESLTIEDTPPLELNYEKIVSVRLFRLHGLGRMIELDLKSQKLYVSVVRLTIGNYLAIVNFFKTKELLGKLQSKLN